MTDAPWPRFKLPRTDMLVAVNPARVDFVQSGIGDSSTIVFSSGAEDGFITVACPFEQVLFALERVNP